MDPTEREIDQKYLQSLEKKLKNLKNPQKLTAKTFLSDIASYKDHQLFRLMAEHNEATGFEDSFMDDKITPNYIQRKIAPQTCAISKQELAKLLKSDTLQMLYEELEKDDFLQELREVAAELKEANMLKEDEKKPEPDQPTTEESELT